MWTVAYTALTFYKRYATVLDLQEFCHRLTKINIPFLALLTYLPKHQALSHIQMLILEVLSVYQNKYKEIK